eukprot:356692-Chlamydomonas_euryale.AAC.1
MHAFWQACHARTVRRRHNQTPVPTPVCKPDAPICRAQRGRVAAVDRFHELDLRSEAEAQQQVAARREDDALARLWVGRGKVRRQAAIRCAARLARQLRHDRPPPQLRDAAYTFHDICSAQRQGCRMSDADAGAASLLL